MEQGARYSKKGRGTRDRARSCRGGQLSFRAVVSAAQAASASRGQSPHEPSATKPPIFLSAGLYIDGEAHSGTAFDVALWTPANFWGVVFLGACQSNSSLVNTNYRTDLLHEIGAEAISIQAALQDEIFLLGTDSRK